MAPHLVLEFENGLINLSLSAGALRALLNAGKKPLRLIRDSLILSSTVLLTVTPNVPAERPNPQLSHRVFCSLGPSRPQVEPPLVKTGSGRANNGRPLLCLAWGCGAVCCSGAGVPKWNSSRIKISQSRGLERGAIVGVLQSQRAFSFIEALREMSSLSSLALGLFNFHAMNECVCVCV